MAINFIGALNAVQKIYADKTNLMVPVGCGEDTPPTPTEFAITKIIIYETYYDGDVSLQEATANQDATGYDIYVQGANNAFEFHLMADENDPTNLVFNFDYYISFTSNALTNGGGWTATVTKDGESLPDETGTYTFIQLPRPIVSNVVVTQVVPQEPEELAEYTITADCNMDPYPNFVVKIKCECMEWEDEMMYRNDHLESGYGDYDSITHFVNGGTWTAYIFDLENSSQTTQTGTYTYIPLT